MDRRKSISLIGVGSLLLTQNAFPSVLSNIGDAVAWEVECTITAQGGILGLINMTATDAVPELAVSDLITISIGPMFGFGPVKITVKAKALNAPEVSGSLDGFVFIVFFIVK